MKRTTIIWDFDGTLLPLSPYDSEQTMMLYKLDEITPRPSLPVRAVARFMIAADRRQMLRKTFKRFYIRMMRGTPATVMDQIGKRLSERIPTQDRQAIVQLSAENYRMMVLSCGTANLSERTLTYAGLGKCFESIAGNRFRIRRGLINGMTLHVPNPTDKVKWLEHKGISADETIAVGDGYTDMPLLDWAKTAVLVDRTGQRQKKYTHKNYHIVQSLPEILDIV